MRHTKKRSLRRRKLKKISRRRKLSRGGNLPVEIIDLNTSEFKIFSQNGEDGIIEAIFNTIGTTNKFYVKLEQRMVMK